jgi:predicted DNA binding CopG/RHH family protein
MPELPKFKTDAEAADWYASHDTAPYMDGLTEERDGAAVVRTHQRKKPVGLRLRPDYLDAIKRVAERKGIPYQTLVQMWLVEGLQREAPELLVR